jgi:hypothetical protein
VIYESEKIKINLRPLGIGAASRRPLDDFKIEKLKAQVRLLLLLFKDLEKKY